MDWKLVVVISVLVVIVMLLFLIRNRKDRKEFEGGLKKNYHKKKDSEHTEDPEDLKNV